MPDTNKPDMSCVPYRRKGLYFALTVPFLLLLAAVFCYLWTYHFSLSLVFASLFLGMSYFQAYCCAYQECPYVGGFCPAVIGIMPASLMAKALYGKGIVKSKRRFEISATLGVACWLGLVVFPLFWLAKLGAVFAIGYVLSHVVYTVLFGAAICPACAIRDICPGGRLSGMVLKRW
ncbi:MAG: hypothetical protein JW950_02740 [Deltaproteobacteria bacterium]|nr:hypothetical protein [Deltaproteobacteria bacterium]